MKKIMLSVFLLFFIPAISFSATTSFVIDDTVDLSVVTGFQLDILDQGWDFAGNAMLQTRFQDEMVLIGAELIPGAVTRVPVWDIFKVFTPNIGVSGLDNTFGSFPLTSGVVFQIDTLLTPEPIMFNQDSFFLMMGFGDVMADVILFNKELADGSVVYTASMVPIPSSLLLLGGGICALLGIRRKNQG